MSSKVFMTRKPDDSSRETVSIVELPERPVNEIEPVLRDEEKAMPEKEQAVKGTEAEKKGAEGKAGKPAVQGINAINNGSKLTGNLVISQDIEITGDVEGDITSEENSNIFIKGTCKGNIKTRGGSVEIDGDMSGGDIVAGGYVKVTGKFHGGKIQAKERIHINGEFSGTLESNEIEVGADAQGEGEIVYKEYLSIHKGAKVEGRIIRTELERKPDAERKPQAERKEETKPKKGFFSKN